MVLLMDYDRVEWLRTQTEAAATGMGTFLSDVDAAGLRPAYLPASAFGSAGGALACRAAWDEVVTQARTANQNLRLALESDAARLGQVIMSFQAADHATADEICSASPNTITVISAHLHSHDDAHWVWDDYLRATQHDRMVDYAASRTGPVIVGVDANVSIDRHGDGDLAEYDNEQRPSGYQPLAPDAVQRFYDEGFENVGDWSRGVPGEGTDSGGRSIDYVWSRGLIDDGTPARVEGDPSDHDGQRVEFRLSHW